MLRTYERSLARVLRHPALTLTVLLITIGVNFLLFVIVPKGFFPQQDTGIVQGSVQGSQDTSYQAMLGKLLQYVNIIKEDDAVATVTAFTGGNTATDTGNMYIALKPLGKRTNSVYEVINRLRPKMARVAGANGILQAGQDLRIGGRQSGAQFQYTLTSDNLQDLVTWAPTLLAKMKTLPGLADVNSDQRNHGLDALLAYDRPPPHGWESPRQRWTPPSTMPLDSHRFPPCTPPLNQYHVVMEVAPKYWQNPEGLNDIYLADHQRRGSALERRDPPPDHHDTYCGQSPGPISRGDALLQSRARRVAQRRRQGD